MKIYILQIPNSILKNPQIKKFSSQSIFNSKQKKNNMFTVQKHNRHLKAVSISRREMKFHHIEKKTWKILFLQFFFSPSSPPTQTKLFHYFVHNIDAWLCWRQEKKFFVYVSLVRQFSIVLWIIYGSRNFSNWNVSLPFRPFQC